MDAVGVDRLGKGLQGIERGGEVGGPDVPAVDHAGDEDLVVRKTLPRDDVEVLRTAQEIEPDPVDREVGEGVVRVTGMTEVRLDDDLRVALRRGDRPVRRLERRELATGEILDEDWLVDLDPFGAGLGQSGDGLGIDGNDPVDQREPVEVVIMGLAEHQEGDRTDEDGLGVDAQRPGLGVRIERLCAGQGEGGRRMQLGNDVVVVGIEPLGHFHRADITLAGATAGHREVGVEVDVAAGPAVPLGHGTDQRRRCRAPGHRRRNR